MNAASAAEAGNVAGVARQPPLAYAAMILMGVSGATMLVIMPGVFAALTAGGSWGPKSIAWLAAGETTGITLATLATAFKIRSLDHRRLAAVALLILALAHAASAQVGTLVLLVGVRLLAGIAEGMLIVNMAALIAMTIQPDRLFALYMASNLGVSTLLLAMLGVLSTAGHGRWIVYVLILLVAAAAALLRWLPRGRRVTDAARAAPKPRGFDGPGQRVGLAGTLILFVGLGASWPQVTEVGRALKLPPGAVPFALSLAAFAGILAGLLAAACGSTFGRRIPVIGGTLLLSLSILWVAAARNRAEFTAAVVSYMFFYIFVVPYYTGIVARLDREGRMASFSMATQFMGMALGPLTSTLLIAQGLRPVFWLAAAACLPAVPLILAADRAAGRQTPVAAEGLAR